MDRTLEAVRRQALAMGCESFHVGILDPEKGMLDKTYSLATLIRAVPYLKAENLRGGNILIRPDDSINAPLVFLDDLALDAAANGLRAAGLNPACVVQSSPTDHGWHAWIRLCEGPLPPEIIGAVARRLAAEFGGDPHSAQRRHFGRLAGFTNRKPEHRRPNGQFPFVLLAQAFGGIAPRGGDLIREARAELAAAGARQRSAAARRTAGLDARELFAGYWREWAECQAGAVDRSAGDWGAACRLLKEGHGVDAVIDAIVACSPDLAERKGARARAYAEATARKAADILMEKCQGGDDLMF